MLHSACIFATIRYKIQIQLLVVAVINEEKTQIQCFYLFQKTRRLDAINLLGCWLFVVCFACFGLNIKLHQTV